MVDVTHGTRRGFPATRLSIVRELSSRDTASRREAFEVLVASYWKPVYTYLRLCRDASPSDAEDWTQGFFVHALERGDLDGYDPERARFRTWLRACLDGYVANERKKARRKKRGGDIRHVSLDFETAEGELRHREIPAGDDIEEAFHREWVRELLHASLEELRTSSLEAGRELEFGIFARYDLEGPEQESRPTYADVAEHFGVPTTKVVNVLHAMRRRLRALVLERVRTLSATDEEFRAEVAAIFDVGRV